MTRPRCSRPPRAPCYLGAGWSSWPGCWEETTPWGWCPSPPAETQTQTGRLELAFSSRFWREAREKRCSISKTVSSCASKAPETVTLRLYCTWVLPQITVDKLPFTALHPSCKFQLNWKKKTSAYTLICSVSDFVFFLFNLGSHREHNVNTVVRSCGKLPRWSYFL